LLRFRFWIVGALLTMTACNADSSRWVGTSDGGSSFDGSASNDAAAFSVAHVRVLDDLPTSGVDLVPGEVLEVRVELTDVSALPVLDARAEIAFIGQSMNSTASILVGYSDVEGVVKFYVQAGSLATSFQLRITVGLVELYVPIRILDRTSQPVEIAVSTAGADALESATIRAYANRTCLELDSDEPASAMITANGGSTLVTGTVMLVDLTSYAVAAAAQTTTGTILTGCIDGVTTATATPTVAVVP